MQTNRFVSGAGAGIPIVDQTIIEHCTFADNVSPDSAAVVESYGGTPLDALVFRNNIVWGNEATTLGDGLPIANFHANILEDTNLPGNLSIDPLLQSSYRLSSNSPAINSGDSINPPPGLTLFGFPRVLGGATDIGADEFHPPLLIFAMDDIGNDETALSFNTVAGLDYQAEFTPNLLLAPSWTNVGPPVTSGMGSDSIVVVPAPGEDGVFRIQLVP